MNYIYETTARIIKKYGTRDPLKLLMRLGTVIQESYSFSSLKGYCFYANRTYYVAVNGNLHENEKRIILAHEAGHIILHKERLKNSPLKELRIYDEASLMEYEANLFAADFLISDEDIEVLSESSSFFDIACKLCVSEDLLGFKIESMKKRGYKYSSPLIPDSAFLKKHK